MQPHFEEVHRTESEQFQSEAAENSSVTAEVDSDLGVDHDLEDMESQLNPDAKEFVPTSPQHAAPTSPFSSGTASALSNRPDLLEDDILAQSPRKNTAPQMDDIVLPSENDFFEISQRPAELVADSAELLSQTNGATEWNQSDEAKSIQRPGSSSSQCSYQEMNLKEAMHGDEKQEFAAEVQDSVEGKDFNLVSDSVSNGNVEQLGFFNQPVGEDNPMNMSFYNDGTEADKFNSNPFASNVDMNAVQPLPDDSEDEAIEIEEKNIINGFVNNPVAEVDNNVAAATNAIEELNLHTQPDLIENLSKAEVEIKGSLSDSEKLFFELEKPEFERIQEESSISQVVHEMATEVTSILNQIEDSQQNTAVPENIFAVESNPFVESNIFAENVTKEFSFKATEPETEDNAESDLQHLQQQIPSQPEVQFEAEFVQQPEPVSSEPPVEVAVPEPQVPAEESNVEAVAAASVAAATAIAAAAATVTAIKSTTSTKLTKPTEIKKPEVKARTATAASTTAAKKPSPTKTSTTSKTTTSTARTLSSPTKTLASKTAAPRVAARTVPPKAPIEKKATTTTTSTTSATRKPLTNGLSSVTKRTTTTTVTKAAPAKSLAATSTNVTTKTTTARVTSATTKAATTTAAKSLKPATSTAARVPLSAR